MVQLVTVFGGSGFVGKQVVRALAKQGWRVRVAVRKPTIAYDLKPMGDVGQIQVVRCDARKADQVAAALENADAVVNLTGILLQGGGQSFDSLHREASATIAEAAAARGITSFVQMSALGADPKSPSKYAASKGQGELAVRKAMPSAVIVRPSLIFGPQDGFFTSLARQVKSLPVMPAIGGGTTKFQPVYVGDVAQAIARLVGNEDAYGQTYELGGPEVLTYSQLVKYVAQEIMTPRAQVWMPFAVASLIGVAGDIQAGLHGVLPLLVPAPPLTSDQVIMLKTDNVVSANALGLRDLGIAATAVESIVPTYLWRFRKNGQFAVMAESQA
ncbi:complex I NDUFA9 subunit family protein [Asticcacaulis sp. EMRT-3]|uniref:complex I NDUFA9 subunit family protein n=1 Tax=Asticcacaulis sp. EMRT-3 TaxID=3040349 RepID=UPI0024AF804E|nr:complex I NDUFA9 subunit family protein [Asticcacaulis sp. EMRT-3]MDI7775591.1 complex I NDUFA9 subunit family protein [Asticcacaulis sp. EMRT-3]